MATEYYSLTLGYNVAGQYAANVFHYRIEDPSDPDEFECAKQLALAIDDGAALSWTTKLQAMLSDQAYISSIMTRRAFPVGSNTARQQFETDDFPGAIASPVHTQQVAACIIWVSESTPGRTARNFMPGVPETALDSSRWTDAFQTLVQAFITKHITGFSTPVGIFIPCIYDRTTHTGPTVGDGYLTPLVGTQRGREVSV